MNTTGERIRDLRVKRGFTQEEMATPLGIGRSNFGHIEKNRVTPSSKQIDMIADQLGTTADYLLCRTNNPIPPGRQTLLNFETGTVDVATISESVAMYNATSKRLKILNLQEQIQKIESNESLGYLEKKDLIDALSSSVELIEKHENKPSVSYIPLVGTICAGDGLYAQENIEEYVNYPINTKSADFALRVRGESMINAGIQDGDIVFFKQKNWFDYNGQIVAVITGDENGTLKRIKWSETASKFQLIPENEEYNTMELDPTEFRICGVFAGVFKPDLD